MALFQINYSSDPTVFNVRAVSAGNPEELQSRLNAEIAAAATAGESLMADFKLGGTGAGPNWEAWFVTSSDVGVGIGAGLSTTLVAAASGSNPVEARLNALAALAAINVSNVFKVEVAGGGIGTIFMAVAVGTFEA